MDSQVILLANPEGKAWDFTKRVYDKILELEKDPSVEHKRHYSLGEVKIKEFDDSEILPKISSSIRGNSCFYFHDSSLNPQYWLTSLLLINDALMGADAKKITDVLPYMKYARQDRMIERTPISTRVVARSIASCSKVSRIITTDLHNPASTGAYNLPFENLKAYPVIIEFLKKEHADFLKDAIILSPDAGSAPRADSYSKRLMIDMTVASKQRNLQGKIEKMIINADISGKNILIVDDMVGTAGTMCRAANELVEKGVKKVYACATHGLFSKDARQKIEDSCLEKVIVTDSIPQENSGKIEVVTLTSLFAEIIHRISHKRSVSQLYI